MSIYSLTTAANLPKSNDSIPTTWMSTDFQRDLEIQKSTLKTSKVALAIFATILAIALAGVAAVITAWVVVPLTVAGPLLLIAALVVSIIGILLVAGSNNVYKKNQEALSADLFNRLLKKDDYELSPEKMKLFHLYGELCTELEIPERKIGIEQGKFLDWLLDDKRKNALTDPTVRTFIESLNTDDNRKLLRSFDQLNAINSNVDKLSHASSQSIYQDLFKEKIEANSEKLISPAQLAAVIYACPNLNSFKPPIAILTYREIKEACQQIGMPDTTKNIYTFSYHRWSTYFPGMVL